MMLTEIKDRCAKHHLAVLGGFHCQDDPDLPKGTQTVLLLGPQEPGFWAHLADQPEWQDKDPIDQWSRRVIGGIACDVQAKALFPFGNAPYHPFYKWALRSGQVWESPIKLLVHSDQGLMVSFRGAIALKQSIALDPPKVRPCDACAQPCLTACPVSALLPSGYDIGKCHTALDADIGADCMNFGCATRRACPLSQSYARLPLHSAYHMRQFHK
jgi:hypothetical protein